MRLYLNIKQQESIQMWWIALLAEEAGLPREASLGYKQMPSQPGLHSKTCVTPMTMQADAV